MVEHGDCIYCGGPLRRIRKGEHIIPDALGGKLTLRTVCQKCNNEFSRLDTELVHRTPLRFLAWRHLGRTHHDTWDWDPRTGIALEAHLRPGLEGPQLWPQVVFREDGYDFRADHDELMAVGWEAAIGEFRKRLRSARLTLRQKTRHPRWIWECIRNLPREWLYPPRIFTKHPPGSTGPRATFICRYPPGYDKAKILRMVDTWDPFAGPYRYGTTLGTDRPEFHFGFAPRLVLRALTKIAVNALANYCELTRVDNESFAYAVGLVRYDRGTSPLEQRGCFVLNEYVRTLDCPQRHHKLLLTHHDEVWHCDFAFFGGEMGAFTAFPGPSREAWNQMEIEIPLGRRDWRVTTRGIIVAHARRLTWMDLPNIIPSVPMTNFTHKVTYERKKQQSSNPGTAR